MKIVIEDPDGNLHGQGPVVASADANRVRPEDCTPRLREILFGADLADQNARRHNGRGRVAQ